MIRREKATEPVDDRLGIIFEDADVLVIDKPAGVAVHEAKGILRRNTVLGMLETRYRPQGIVPQLVHRLDQDTSGVLVVAKNAGTGRDLERAFAGARVEKEYTCLVAGRLHENKGAINIPLPGRRGFEVRAATRFAVVKRFSETTLLRVWIATGRMHQIRLHFAQLGYPVVLDQRHGDFSFNRAFRKAYGLKRQFLHAARISLTYKGEKRAWSARLPSDLERTLQALERQPRQRRLEAIVLWVSYGHAPVAPLAMLEGFERLLA